ncbi:MAG TPA: response regulator [Candidatus Limnocylindria bacterium]|nr:response regulator [Candidatus Limnocylindria bacterium]
MNSEQRQLSVLCVDDDRDLAEVVQAVLVDEGYAVSCLYSLEDDALPRALGRLEPDVVLLDSGSELEYGPGWDIAAGIRHRGRPVPVVMFSAHRIDTNEAREGVTDRAREAGFAAILPKPFDLDDLLAAVAQAAGRSVPFDSSVAGDQRRTRALVKLLTARGATDIKPSKMREWALFRDGKHSLLQIYWWQQRGVYQLGRYEEDGRLTMIGQFVELDAALELALPQA